MRTTKKSGNKRIIDAKTGRPLSAKKDAEVRAARDKMIAGLEAKYKGDKIGLLHALLAVRSMQMLG